MMKKPRKNISGPAGLEIGSRDQMKSLSIHSKYKLYFSTNGFIIKRKERKYSSAGITKNKNYPGIQCIN